MRQALTAFGVFIAASLARPRHVLLALAGFAISAGVLVALLAIPRAIGHTAAVTGGRDIALLIGRTSEFASGATLPSQDAAIARDLPGVTAATPELVATKKLRRADGTESEVLLRGVSKESYRLARPRVRILAGRRPRPGSNEIMAGAAAAHSFPQLRLGARVRIAKTLWRVTGIFSARGSLWESEIWAPLGTLQSALNAGGRSSLVKVRLASAHALARLKKAVAADPRLQVRVEPERAYYARQVGFLVRFARIGAWGITLLLGLAALAAVANAVGLGLIARRGELAVLRMLGFARKSLAIALLAEVLATGAFGAALASCAVWLALRHASITTSNGSQTLAIHLGVAPALVGIAIGFALLLGLISAVGPCWHALTRPLPSSLRNG